MHEHVPMRRLCRRPGFFAAGLETYLGLARAPCARAQHAMLRGHCSWYEECSAHAKHASWRASVLSATFCSVEISAIASSFDLSETCPAAAIRLLSVLGGDKYFPTHPSHALHVSGLHRWGEPLRVPI